MSVNVLDISFARPLDGETPLACAGGVSVDGGIDMARPRKQRRPRVSDSPRWLSTALRLFPDLHVADGNIEHGVLKNLTDQGAFLHGDRALPGREPLVKVLLELLGRGHPGVCVIEGIEFWHPIPPLDYVYVPVYHGAIEEAMAGVKFIEHKDGVWAVTVDSVIVARIIRHQPPVHNHRIFYLVTDHAGQGLTEVKTRDEAFDYCRKQFGEGL